MPKLLWVLLPLFAAALWLAWRWWRRQPPSRQALNVGFSLLLLLYVLSTAALGIFWVANQQLPVFDWHYLFGYATLLLLALHLGFNARIVWRFFVPPARRSAAAYPAPRPGRRAFGLAAALLGIAAAYALGLRQGRQGAAGLAGGAPPAAGEDDAFAAVQRFHVLSSNSRRGVLRAPGVDWGDAPPAFKHLAPQPALRLPDPRAPLSGRLDLQTAAMLLWHVAGVTDHGTVLRLRASPSSGALFATELYLAAVSVDGLAPGLWHYDALGHGLHPVASGADAARSLMATADASARGAAALVVATAVFRRSGHKYRDRTYRYVLADLGHALENLHLGARHGALQPRFVPRFDELRSAALLGLDTAEEGVLAMVALWPRDAAPDLDHPLPDGRWEVPPAADTPPLGLTGAMHAASSLRQTEQAATTTLPPQPAPPEAWPDTLALPQPMPMSTDVLQLIAQRRSRRRFASRPVTLAQLSGVLAAMAAPPMLLPAQNLHIHVVAHAVDGLAPGAYRYDAAGHALQPRRAGIPLRDAARRAALDQDVIGDAAVVFVLAIDAASLRHDPVGPARAYRHALLHTGCIGERIYLAGGAHDLGVCAVGAFHDDEAAALVAADPAREWVLHFAALGPV